MPKLNTIPDERTASLSQWLACYVDIIHRNPGAWLAGLPAVTRATTAERCRYVGLFHRLNGGLPVNEYEDCRHVH